ncbi:YncE family protein [Pseudorhodoferax sp.]|uniref:YncE family protein n=1 Tax=Pseudorhodoferax sp. TaxID=1993553 RepID=UPI002DD62682|nr:YncE family protein [Pseudorhodoferax sp.]
MNNRRPAARSARHSAPWARPVQTVLAVSMALGLAACASSPTFDAQDAAFKGRVSVADTPVVLAGKPVTLAGRDFKPGQKVTLSYGGVELAQTATADKDGNFRTQFVLPAAAEPGRYSLVASAANPAASLLVPLKISPNVPLSGQERFNVQSQTLVPGLYQAGYSAKTDRVFVTSAVGRPPVTRSELVKVNAQTLAIEQRVTAPVAPTPPARPGAPAPAANAPALPGLYAVYGVGVDDANGNVWVTNTRQNTVAVYRQSDLAVVKQFEPGVVPHARDVLVDGLQGKAYASPVGEPQVAVFNTKTPAFLKNIPIQSGIRGPNAKDFSPMSLALDQAGSRLFVVSSGGEVAIVNTKTDAVEKVFAVEAAVSASGIAYDAQTDRVFVAAQGSDNVVIVDAKTGKTLHDVKVGAGTLNVTFDPVKRVAYAANRASDTVTILDPNGKIVGNLDVGSFPNHIAIDGKGTAFTVNKARGSDDGEGDRIGRITLR